MRFTDVNLAGKIDGVELARFTTQCYPNIHVIVSSGLTLTKSLPEWATFMPKPWGPMDVLREAERSQDRRHGRAAPVVGASVQSRTMPCTQRTAGAIPKRPLWWLEKARIPLTYPLIIRYFRAWSWLVGIGCYSRRKCIAELGASAAWPSRRTRSGQRCL